MEKNDPHTTQSASPSVTTQSSTLQISDHPFPRHFSKWMVILIISSFLLVIISIISIQLLGYRQFNKQAQLTNNTPGQVLNRESTSSASTANWKTYIYNGTKSIPGFQIKYPPTWDYRITSAGDTLSVQFYTSSIGNLSHAIYDTSEPDDSSLPQPFEAPVYIKIYTPPVPPGSYGQNLIINNLPASKSGRGYYEGVDFTKNDLTYFIGRPVEEFRKRLNLDKSVSQKTELEIFNSMLSTFKFL